MNRKKNKKNKILKIMTLVFTILLIIPFSKVDADVTDCTTESGCTTNSKTTLVKTETTTEEVPYDTDLDAYIANKKASDPNLADSVSYKNEWEALYVSENGVYKYPVFIQTVFTGVTISSSDECSGSILVGDPEDLNNIQSGCATYNYEVRYKEITVVKASNPYEIKELNLTVTIPTVGDEITYDESDPWDTQRPQATITVPSDAKYKLAGGASKNYMYYIESLDEYQPFKGKFEKNNTYHMEIWLIPSENYFFSENVKIKINGTELSPDEYEIDEISVLYDFTPKEVVYEILDGANQTLNVSLQDNLTVRASGELSKFVELRVDGNVVDPKHYTKKEGSTIVTLNESYLSTLSVGNHTLTFIYTDGSTSTNFIITKVNNPETGDNILLYISLGIISAIGIVVLQKNKRLV